MEPFIVGELPSKEVVRGIRIRPVHLEKMTVTFVDIEPDAVLPEHRHPHEQISCIIKGTLRFVIEGKTFDISEGQGITIPANVPHSATVVAGPVIAIDAFSPRRDDYVIKR